MDIHDLLRALVERQGSDLHLKVGTAPAIRVDGKLAPVEGGKSLAPAETRALMEQLLSPDQVRAVDETGDLDMSYSMPGVARFRVNCMRQRGSYTLVIRRIPVTIPTLEEIKAPEAVKRFCDLPRGLVLVTGPTGSGKSTTLAAMIDHINRRHHGHILTLEDPIEFVHKDQNCFVNQREIGSDSRNFAEALRRALRQDPDVILIGEMRDLETISLAVTAAETGHLVFGTLHTTGAVQTVDRIVDVFPEAQHNQIRMQLSMGLGGVISQCLVPRIGGGRACAMEIMVGTDAVRSLVREGKTQLMGNLLQTGAKVGMQTMDGELARLVKERVVTREEALTRAQNPQVLQQMLGASAGSGPGAAAGMGAMAGARA